MSTAVFSACLFRGPWGDTLITNKCSETTLIAFKHTHSVIKSLVADLTIEFEELTGNIILAVMLNAAGYSV